MKEWKKKTEVNIFEFETGEETKSIEMKMNSAINRAILTIAA